MTIMQSTRQSVSLTLQVISEEDNGSVYIHLMPLLSLTWLIMAAWQLMIVVNTIRFKIAVWWLDFQSYCEIIYAVTSIVFNALAFGLGLRL